VNRGGSMVQPTFLVMRLRSKLIPLALLGTLASASPAMRMSGQPAATPHRPASCHQHGQPAPASVPASYKCCEVAHHPALLEGPPVLHLSLFHALRELPEFLPALSLLTRSKLFLDLADPPGSAVLRI
jgi:hypothetical protein